MFCRAKLLKANALFSRRLLSVQAGKMAKEHVFNVAMTCSGCSGAVQRVLGKLEGVEKVDISLEKQEVRVTTDLPADTVLAQIKKTGKETKLVS